MKQYDQRDILLRLINLLHKHNLPYLLTGSYAVSIYGYPRATHDIDFVIETEVCSRPKISQIIKELGDDYVADAKNLLTQIKHSGQFNIYHIDTGIKIDFWINDPKEFQQKIKRAQYVAVENKKIAVVSPEDLLLKKLEWCKAVFSERHFRDCVGIWKLQKQTLNKKYLESRAKKLTIGSLLKDVQTNSNSVLS